MTMSPASQITFLYFEDLAEPARFFEECLGFECADDQGTCRIYRVAEGAFVGVVAGKSGHRRPQPESAVLVTFVTDDLAGWRDRVAAYGARDLTEIRRPASFPVECFFFRGPGGYHFEVQRFLSPDVRRRFGQSNAC